MKMRRARAYFNHAGLSRPAPAIIGRVRAAEHEYGDFLFSEAGVEMYVTMLNDCRSAVADVLGVDGPQGVSLLSNATTAVQMVLSALGASLKPQDLVITSDQEHPCVGRPLNMLAKRGVEIAQIEASSEAEFVDRMNKLLRKRRPAFVVISHVSYKNGRILPVEEIGRLLAGREIPYIVDGAQAFGHIAVDVPATGAWAYTLSGHKWLGGPWGTGGLWASQEFATRNNFTLCNWEDRQDPPTGGRYEGGTANFGILAGLAQACRHFTAERDERLRILSRLREEISACLEGVYTSATASWSGRAAPGILAYLMPESLNSWILAEQLLDRYGVAIKPFRPPERPDAVRISFSIRTTAEEIELLKSAIRSIRRSTA
jgi:selenocysteine lyase/cysteine desulfurase